MTQRQCSVPLKNNTRCPNTTPDDDKMLCIIHNKAGYKVYMKYKKLCVIADSLNLDQVYSILSAKEKINYLMKCYNSYIAAYNGRMKYRDNFVVPECRDYGHDVQFIIIQRKIDDCELQFKKLYDEIILHQQKDIHLLVEEENDTSYDTKEEDLSFIEKVKTFKQRRADDIKETNKVITNYIKDNRVILREKKKMIDFCYNILLKFVKSNKLVYQLMMCMMYIYLDLWLVKIIEEKVSSPLDRSYSDYRAPKLLNLSTKLIKSYTNIRDFFNENQIQFVISLNTILNELGTDVDDVMKCIQKHWDEIDFDIDRVTFRHDFVGGKFTFEIVNKI